MNPMGEERHSHSKEENSMAMATYEQQTLYEEVYDLCRLMASPRFPSTFKWMNTTIEFLDEGTKVDDGFLKQPYWKATDNQGNEYRYGMPHHAGVGIVSMCEKLSLGRVREPIDR